MKPRPSTPSSASAVTPAEARVDALDQRLHMLHARASFHEL
jgi:hypothetical protein